MSYFNTARRMNALVVVLLVVNIISISALWLAKNEKRSGPPLRPKNGELFLKEALGLSPSQLEEIKLLRENHFQEMQALRKASDGSRRKMFEEIKAVKPDSLLLVKYAEQIGSAQAAIEKQTIHHFIDIKSVLEPEQLVKFNRTLERLLPPPPPPPGGPDRPERKPPPGH